MSFHPTPYHSRLAAHGRIRILDCVVKRMARLADAFKVVDIYIREIFISDVVNVRRNCAATAKTLFSYPNLFETQIFPMVRLNVVSIIHDAHNGRNRAAGVRQPKEVGMLPEGIRSTINWK